MDGRPLTSRERETLEFMLSTPFPGRDELLSQVPSVVATGRCGCGCASISLVVADPEAKPATDVRERMPVEASSDDFGLLLFVDDGFLSYLEIYSLDGSPPREFPPPETFGRPLPEELDPAEHLAPLTAYPVELADGVAIHVVELGSGFPLIVLHGGPGLDHRMFRPYLDPLADEFRLLYVDQRGQGLSERVDPTTLSVDVFARDVDLLAEALGLARFALLGHSFGAIVATRHAIELGTAGAYVISGGGDSSEMLLADVSASFEAMGEAAGLIAESWEREKTVETEDDVHELLRVQMPFHFAGDPPPGYGDDTVYSPAVLRHFANMGYGDFDYASQLDRVSRPTLVVVGELDRTTTVRAARVLDEGIAGSELVVVPGVGHMSFVEAPAEYLRAVRGFLRAAVRTEATA